MQLFYELNVSFPTLHIINVYIGYDFCGNDLFKVESLDWNAEAHNIESLKLKCKHEVDNRTRKTGISG